jgi:hypothetical protein
MKLPSLKGAPPEPTRSPALLPTKLLAAETGPVTPAAPLPQVAAPRLPFQDGLKTM